MNIIAICGASGSGKTVLSQNIPNAKPLVSYTTRPMRPDETNGVEHWFVSETEYEKEQYFLAQTTFPPNNGYHYWTSFWQLFKALNDGFDYITYVVDEQGLFDLQHIADEHPEIQVIKVKLYRSNLSSIDEERKKRDKDRIDLPDSYYDIIVHNDTTIDAMVSSFVSQLREYNLKKSDELLQQFL